MTLSTDTGDLAAEVQRLREGIEQKNQLIVSKNNKLWEARHALGLLLDWAENIEGEGRLRRTQALALAREALKETKP